MYALAQHEIFQHEHLDITTPFLLEKYVIFFKKKTQQKTNNAGGQEFGRNLHM